MISQEYKIRPSKILNIENSYEAFCFDEACIYIQNHLQDEKSPDPKFTEDIKNKKSKSQNADTIEWMLKHSKPI